MSFARFFICCSSSEKVVPASNSSVAPTIIASPAAAVAIPAAEIKQITVASNGSAAPVTALSSNISDSIPLTEVKQILPPESQENKQQISDGFVTPWQDDKIDSRKKLLEQIVRLLENQIALNEDKELPRDLPLEVSEQCELKDRISRNAKRTLRSLFSGEENSISLKDYLLRFMMYFDHLVHPKSLISDSVFVGMLVVLNKYFERHSMEWLHNHNVHRLILASFVVTYKFLEDIHWNNEYVAQVGGVSNSALNKMEAEFFKIINFNVCIPVDKYDEMVRKLKENEAKRCGFPKTEADHRIELLNETLFNVLPSAAVRLVRDYTHEPHFWSVPRQQQAWNPCVSRNSPESEVDEDNFIGISGRTCLPR